MKAKSLSDRASRAKARWLKRVMYESSATSTQKCFAYAICDHLNCVTLDCWPAQSTFTRLLGGKSTRTAQRAARGLANLGLITLKRNDLGKSEYRYAPIFLPKDTDNFVGKHRQLCPEKMDTDVRESSLEIHFRSSSTEEATELSKRTLVPKSSFKPAERGAIELKLADMLGINGMDVLARLSAIDDAIVDRLCRAWAEGVLGERDLAAARLAAKQA
jgi:hypothetical protein